MFHEILLVKYVAEGIQIFRILVDCKGICVDGDSLGFHLTYAPYIEQIHSGNDFISGAGKLVINGRRKSTAVYDSFNQTVIYQLFKLLAKYLLGDRKNLQSLVESDFPEGVYLVQNGEFPLAPKTVKSVMIWICWFVKILFCHSLVKVLHALLNSHKKD